MIQKPRIQSSSGMTLLEIVISLAVISVLMLVIMTSFTLLMKSSLSTMNGAELRGQAKVVYTKLTNDVHKAESIHVYQKDGHDYLKVRSPSGWTTYDLNPADTTLYHNGQPLARAKKIGNTPAFIQQTASKSMVNVSLSVEDKESSSSIPVVFSVNSEVTSNMVTCQDKPVGAICISTADELAKIGNDPLYPLNGTYFQIANIDMTAYRSGEGWTPIGPTDSSSFTGRYEGNGYRIIGLQINRPEGKWQGLFGYVSNAAIHNLHLEDVSIIGKEMVGALTGSSINSSISDCSIQGKLFGFQNIGGLVGENGGNLSQVERCSAFVEVDGNRTDGSVTGSVTGGLVGWNRDQATISRSSAAGMVTGSNHTGGLTGCNSFATITDSYAISDSTGKNVNVGGLVGTNYGSDARITNCYASGHVSGLVGIVGGLVGENANGALITLSKSYGTVDGPVTYLLPNTGVGGLVGRNMASSTVNDSHAYGNTIGATCIGGLVGVNDEGIVTNSTAQGTVQADESNAGGLVGLNMNNSKILASTAKGPVKTKNTAGGLVGLNTGSFIENSSSQSSVQAENEGGGLVGRNDNTSDILNSSSSGMVTGTTNIGALVGWNLGGSSVRYSTSSQETTAFPLIGQNDGILILTP